jgi:PA14 domain.
MGANKEFFDTNYPIILTTNNYTMYDLAGRREKPPSRSEIMGEMNLTDQKHGLRIRYYDSIHWKNKPVDEGIVEHIGFSWDNEERKPVSSPFGVILEGFLDIQISGTYTFKITSDDGSWLFLDNVLIIDNGGHHAMKSATAALALEKGLHKIMIQYFDAGGGAILNLSWTPPGGVESEIPAEQLYTKE